VKSRGHNELTGKYEYHKTMKHEKEDEYDALTDTHDKEYD
jgi:hypothetical protein